jgi:hypothetical protein
MTLTMMYVSPHAVTNCPSGGSAPTPATLFNDTFAVAVSVSLRYPYTARTIRALVVTHPSALAGLIPTVGVAGI